MKLRAGNSGTAENLIVDLSNTTGVTTVEVNNIATGAIDTVTVDKITTQKVVVTGSALTGNIVEAKLADASGATDSATIELKAGSTISGVLALKATDIETVNLKAGVAADVSLANVSIAEASKFAKVVVTGDKALTISALNADVNNIDASGMTTGGSVIQTGRSGTDAATYVGTVGADTFIMANGGDAISAGDGADTLVINFNAILGGMAIDLNATGDQITTFNGSANAAVQSGFNNVNLSNLQGTSGADITAHKDGSTITGTANADQITGGAGNDSITGGAGADVINGGAGNDTITGGDGNDNITGGDGTDTLNIAGSGTTTLTTDANLVTIENITFTSDSNVLDLTNQTEAFNVTTANGTNFITVNATVADTLTGGSGADTFIINTVDGHAFLPQATIAGGTGTSDQITLGLATTTLVDADFASVTGVEILQLTGVSTIVLGTNATTTGIKTVNGQNTAAANNLSITSTSTVMDTVVAGASNTGTVAVSFGNIGDNTASVTAGAGNVTVTGGAADDTITVTGLATASQTFTGSVSKFNVTGGADGQNITTGAADDTIDGGAGDDSITGGLGDDSITGGLGDDSITAGAGDDTIVLGASGDIDTIIYGVAAVTDGTDTITGFTAGTDVIRFTDGGATAIVGAATKGYAAGLGTSDGLGDTDMSAANVIVITDTQTQSGSAIQTMIGTINGGGGNDIGNGVFIVSGVTDGTTVNLWYDASAADGDAVLIGVIDVTFANIANLTTGSFSIVA